MPATASAPPPATTLPGIGQREFVALIALMSSMVALSIDVMLPALEIIGHDLGTTDPNDNQMVISFLFFGFSVGQLFFGSLSDSIGRKPTIFAGLTLFMTGCLMAALAETYATLLMGRFLQGVGVASPRTVSIALVRDLYTGRRMARIMSLVMTVFILVPVLAPALGQGLLAIGSWRILFAVLLLLALIVLAWFGLRHPETLPPEKQRPFSLRQLAATVNNTCHNRITLGYTLAMGMIFGAFIGYLVSVQQILQKQYALEERFPVYFGLLALCVGAATVTNARLVMKWGMQRLVRGALILMTTIATGVLLLLVTQGTALPLGGWLAWGGSSLFCMGILFGNLTALAMEPMGHHAGVAASVVGSLSSLISLSLGSGIGQMYDGTVMPLVGGFVLSGLGALGMVQWTERHRIRTEP
ncbi:MAG: multidrug effflux MFS transporter [Magnetococcales bacterium]|nr:multidrug effflux MFS transporter [Magnetococcales bacterium]